MKGFLKTHTLRYFDFGIHFRVSNFEGEVNQIFLVPFEEPSNFFTCSSWGEEVTNQESSCYSCHWCLEKTQAV